MLLPFLIQGDGDKQIFTGTPHGPTANISSRTTQLATTEFVQNLAVTNVHYNVYTETLQLKSGNAEFNCYVPSWGWIPPDSATVALKNGNPDSSYLATIGETSTLRFTFKGGSDTFWTESNLVSLITCTTNGATSNVAVQSTNLISKSIDIGLTAQSNAERVYSIIFRSPSGNPLKNKSVTSKIESSKLLQLPTSIKSVISQSQLPSPFLLVKDKECILRFIFDGGVLWTNNKNQAIASRF